MKRRAKKTKAFGRKERILTEAELKEISAGMGTVQWFPARVKGLDSDDSMGGSFGMNWDLKEGK